MIICTNPHQIIPFSLGNCKNTGSSDDVALPVERGAIGGPPQNCGVLTLEAMFGDA